MVDVRFDSRVAAIAIRKSFVIEMKGGMQFSRLHIANSLTLATRVRVDILKAIVNQFSFKGKKEMYLVAYNSHPVMITKVEGGEKTFTLTFADAVAKYGRRLDQDNLADAYKRAGRSFRGLLQQNFVVLKDETETATTPPQEGHRARNWQKKRPLEDPAVIFGREGEGNSANANRGQNGGNGRGRRGEKSARQ
jgi:hypothetical protein